MKAGADWRDALASLASGMDAGEDVKEVEEVETVKKENKKVTIFYERKGRAGKEATILADFEDTDNDEIETLASELKRKLGVGGSVRNGEILIQGDRREKLRTLLGQKGFKVKG